MRIFVGILIGLVLAVAIAIGAAKYAFGDLGDVADRDKSQDITRTLDITGFDAVDIGGVFEADVTVGGDYSVVVSGSEDEMARLEVRVENGVLKIDQNESEIGKRRWRQRGMTASISLPELKSFELAGVGDGEVTGIDAELFRVKVAGVGNLDLSGACGRLDAKISGVGELDAKSLECREVDVDVSGVGSASVFASDAVDASVGGVGSIEIHGSPERVEKRSSFISSISVK